MLGEVRRDVKDPVVSEWGGSVGSVSWYRMLFPDPGWSE